MILFNNHKNCLIAFSNNLNKLLFFDKNFSTKVDDPNQAILSQQSTSVQTSFNDESIESYQFNEELIKRIKKNQLFNFKYLNVKQIKNKSHQEINLSSDVQKYLPSVSKVISETMTEDNLKILEIWRAKMIKKLGFEGFQKYQNDVFSRGKRLHKNIEYKLKQQEENIKIDEDINGFWSSLQPILSEIKEVHLIEKKLSHPNLLYKGVVDCVARFNNKLDTVIDWKTSEKIKDNVSKLYDAPVQTIAYLGALNHSDLLNFEINKVAVVIAYNNGRIANYHQLDTKECDKFWSTWTTKLEQYWIKTLSKSPIDSCLVNYFDQLLTLSEEENKKVYCLNKNPKRVDSVDNEIVEKINQKQVQNILKNKETTTKKYKTKEELAKLVKKNRKCTSPETN